ncbi:MAG: hypothetical protein Q9212_006144, partial [Teloschistes hypoglaucus]
MPATRRAGSSSHGRSVTDQVNNAHYSTSQPRVRESHSAESLETTKEPSIYHSSCNPGLVAQSFPSRPPSPDASPRQRWRQQAYVQDSEEGESEVEAKLHKRQAVPDVSLTRPPQGDSVKIPIEYQISNWVSYVPPVRPDTPLREPDSADSFSTVATDIILGEVWADLGDFFGKVWDFHQAGHLPQVDPDLDMEEATQKVAVPRVTPRGRLGDLSDDDRADILCILSPNSVEAHQAVELVAKTAPQHILQRHLVSSDIRIPINGSPQEATGPNKAGDIGGEMAVEGNTSPKAKRPPLDIALRLSSKIQNPNQGFAFGRAASRVDLLISNSWDHRVSGLHFCIYINSKGSLMCRDESTNGTFVDGRHLKRDGQPGDFGPQSTIHDSSTIELLYGDKAEAARFWVVIPDRTGVKDRYARKLHAYTAYLHQLERAKEIAFKCKMEGLPMEAPAAPILPFAEDLRGPRLSSKAKDTLVAGTEPYNYGMIWNGGDTYQVTGRIGHGAQGHVYKVARRRDGEVFAVKEVSNFLKDRHGNLSTQVTQELKIIKRLEHPNIVQYIDQHKFGDKLYIVMEFVNHGDLQTCLRGDRSRFREDQAQAVASQMCQALKYLHDCNITHRDIKPDNILISHIDPYEFKLSDFGLSKIMNLNGTVLDSFCGTLLYCAPEVYPGFDAVEPTTPRKKRRTKNGSVVSGRLKAAQPYTSAVDTWGLAAVLFHLLTGTPPYEGTTGGTHFGQAMISVLLNTSVNWDRLVHGGVSEIAVDFLQRMLVVDPSQRLSDEECLAHPWITDGPSIGEHLGSFTQNTQQSSQNVNTRDTERADPEELSAFASQLSLDNYNRLRSPHAHNDEDVHAKALGQQPHAMVESKRKREGQYDSEDDLSNLSVAASEDDLIPSFLHNQNGPPPTKKMYGEIDPAALRSSGTLGRNAHAALELSSQRHKEVSMSDSHYEGESMFSINDYPTDHGRVTSAYNSQANESGGDAPSLYGAEALVEEMNMDSSMADVPSQEKENHPSAAGVEDFEEHSKEVDAGTTVSANSSQGLYSATPPQSPKFKKPSMSGRGAKGPSVQPEGQAASFPDQQPMAEKSARRLTAANATSYAEQDISSASANAPSKAATTEQAQPSTPQSKPAHHQPSSTSKASRSKTTASTATPSINLPLPTNDFGSLIPTSGSAPCPILKLTNRITSFGRNPINTYQWPDRGDPRVPKLACDIIFWRPGIDHDLKINPNLNWQAYGDITAIITTRTSQHIMVNDVQLRRGAEADLYGHLHTGDIISIFEPSPTVKLGPGKASEHLRFRVELTIGKSKEPRKAEDLFHVIEEKGVAASGQKQHRPPPPPPPA